MTLPKEIVEKMEQVNALMKEIDLWMDDNLELDGSKHNHRKYFTNEYNHPDHYEFTDEPSGEEQTDGEYCNQSTFGESGDSFYGTYYYPTEKGNYFCFKMKILLIISLLLNIFLSFCGLYLSLELKKKEESEGKEK